MTTLIRDATRSDAARCLEIYAPYVRDTVISFETEVPTPAEMAQRIEAAVATHAWLVLEDDGRVVGYAYGAPFNPRAAYRWSTSVSVYTELGRWHDVAWSQRPIGDGGEDDGPPAPPR